MKEPTIQIQNVYLVAVVVIIVVIVTMIMMLNYVPILSHTVQRTRVIESVDAILQLPVHGPPRAVFITHSFRALRCYNGLASMLSSDKLHARISLLHTVKVDTVSQCYAMLRMHTKVGGEK